MISRACAPRELPLSRRGMLSSIGATFAATAIANPLSADQSLSVPLSIGQAVLDITPTLGIEFAGFHKPPGQERRITGIRQETRRIQIARVLISVVLATLLSGVVNSRLPAADGDNPYAYLDEYSSPYYPHTHFPKLTTPQWVGEPDIEAVIVLGIDDMRDTAKYEMYLRPILDRLKQIDGRAPVSIMTCQVDPSDPQLQSWLAEGLSFETHTVDHPCPCLQSGQLDQAKSTYDRCVDLVSAIPNNKPVAFRFPCMDSQNTPSPRAYAEIINQTTPAGNFLQASTSVVSVFTSRDPEIPRSITLNSEGEERFERYMPFPSFVNKIENYPYPFVIGRKCWEFPCMIPDDWQGQNIQQPNNPRTVNDMLAAIDATVVKKGIANIVFHPYEWIRSEQIAEVVDRVHAKYGRRVKFLTFQECIERINSNLLLNQPLRRTADGGDNGVRILDLNLDGYLDVMIGNDQCQVARVWDPAGQQWQDISNPVKFISNEPGSDATTQGVQFGRFVAGKGVSVLINHEQDQSIYQFTDDEFVRSPLPHELVGFHTSQAGVDQGVRLRDLDLDGTSEILVANPKVQLLLDFIDNGTWRSLSLPLPAPVVDAQGGDNGARFVDLDKDGYDDFIVSNSSESAVYLYDDETHNFTRSVEPDSEIPRIARGNTDNGAWFADDHMWVQNEDTNRLPDGVDRRTFSQLTGNAEPGPRSAEQSLKSMRVRLGFTIELVAAEPLTMDPVAIDFGPDGKLWVVEMADYPLGLDDHGKPGGRVRYLEDLDGDGTYDKSSLFLDNIAFPTGVLAVGDGVIVSAAPKIFYAEDTDGDGVADVKTVLYTGFGEGNQQHRVNGFERGLDNWIYLANGDSGGTIKSIQTGQVVDIRGQDLRIRPTTGEFDLQAGQTQFGRHRDDYGNWFGSNNSVPVRHYAHPAQYLRRNSLVPPAIPSRDIARLDNTQVFPRSRVLSHWSGYVPPTPGEKHAFTSACSTIVYRDNLLGPEFMQSTFTCEPVHNLVQRRQLVPAGASFKCQRPEDEADFEFLASEDSWFRPASVTTGPDGAIWIADMYRLVMEHPEWIDDEREQTLELRAGHDRGRIYRVFPTDQPPRPILKLSSMSTQQLVEQLDSPSGRNRDLAQAMLIGKQDPDAIEPLQQTVATSPNPLARLHALCTLDGLDALVVESLEIALRDPDPTVRRHALRLSERWLRGDTHPTPPANPIPDSTPASLLSAVLHCDAADLHVRQQMAYSLGYSDAPQAVAKLGEIAGNSFGLPVIREAVISSLRPATLAAFQAAIQENPRAVAAYQEVILEMAVRSGEGQLLSSLVESLVLSLRGDAPDPTRIDALTKTLKTLRHRTVELAPSAASLIDDLQPQAAQWAADPRASSPLRIAALRMYALLGRDSSVPLNLLTASQPVDVQIAAADGVVNIDPQAILGRLASLSPVVRQAALNAILARESAALQLIAALEAEEVPLYAISDESRRRLHSHASDEVKAAAIVVFGELSSATEKRSLLQRYLANVLEDGDPQRGASVFQKQCAACHRVKEMGHAIGPDIASLKDRTPKTLLTAILDPNLAVEDKYQGYHVLTLDGQLMTGVISNESSTAIELQMQEGKRHSILRDDIEWIRTTGVSLMPEGLEKAIPPEEMNHLLAYLNASERVPTLAPAPAASVDGNELAD